MTTLNINEYLGKRDGDNLPASDWNGVFSKIQYSVNELSADQDLIKEVLKGQVIGTDRIADDAVTNAKLDDLSVTANKLANGAVTNNKVAENAIGTTNIKDAAVTTNKIAAKAVTTAKLGDKSVTSIKLGDGSITPDKLSQDVIDMMRNINVDSNLPFDGIQTESVTVATSSKNVTSTNYNIYYNQALSAFVLAEIPSTASTPYYISWSGFSNSSDYNDGRTAKTNTIFKYNNTLYIFDGTSLVEYYDFILKDGSVTTSKIASGAVTNTKIADEAVDYSKIMDGAVTDNKIMDFAITEDKIADGAVTMNKLGSDVIGSSVAEGSDLLVTGDAVYNAIASIPQGEVTPGSITTDKIASEAVTLAKINPNVISSSVSTGDNKLVTSGAVYDAIANIPSSEVTSGSITTNKLANGAVTTDKIANQTITVDNINPNVYTDSVLSGNTKLVTSGGVFNKIAELADVEIINVADYCSDGDVLPTPTGGDVILYVYNGEVLDHTVGTFKKGSVVSTNLVFKNADGTRYILFSIPSRVFTGNYTGDDITDQMKYAFLGRILTTTKVTEDSALPITSGGVYDVISRLESRIAALENN